MHVDLPGRYLIKMVVLDQDALWAPSPACPAHAYMVLDAGPVGPIVPAGDPCDRARAAGLAHMEGIVLSTNRPMLQLAHALGFTLQHDADDPRTVRARLALGPR